VPDLRVLARPAGSLHVRHDVSGSWHHACASARPRLLVTVILRPDRRKWRTILYLGVDQIGAGKGLDLGYSLSNGAG